MSYPEAVAYSIKVVAGGDAGMICEQVGKRVYGAYRTLAEAEEAAKASNLQCEEYGHATRYAAVVLPAGLEVYFSGEGDEPALSVDAAKAKHTQGEWARNIKPARKYQTIFAGRNTHVCHLATLGLSDDEIEANCNLIVAAPELLAACKKAAQVIECSPLPPGTFAGVLATLRAAIAKAEA